MASRLEEIRNERITKLKKLVALGISPFPAQSHKEVANGTVVSEFEKYDGKTISLTGRLRALREHGKLAFGDLEDQSGKIQLLLRASNLVALDKKKRTLGFEELSLVDVGDFVEAKGLVCKSKTGAISLDVQEFRLLTKTIRPLPDSWEGLKDADTIFRRRYLDLAINKDHRDLFIRKSKFWAVARMYMAENGFLEVETPVLEHVTGGADAKPFETHHNALDETFYMRISTELYQKRLLGGGFEKIYTLAPNFRNEGIDDEHLQEYYQLEWYWAYADFRDNMTLTRDLFRRIARDVYGTTKFTRGVHTFDLAGEWEELDYTTVILNKLGIDIFNDSESKMASVLMKHGVKLDGKVGKARLVDNLWKIIRADVAGPAFLINVPKFISPLAKSYADNESLTERFQIILAGSELCNGYSELNDPMDQLARFMDQQSQRDAGDDEAQMLDIDYVEMLEYGMPPASGLGVSERLFWFLENVTAREGTLFPQMKRHVSQLTKSIYGIEEEKSKPKEEVYDYAAKKIVAVIDSSMDKGKIANSLGHMAFSAGRYMGEGMMGKEKLEDGSGNIHTGISKYPFIILSANTEQVSEIVKGARKLGIKYVDYPEAMFKTGNDMELSKTLSKQSEDKISYRGVLLVGKTNAIENLTGELPLYKGETTNDSKVTAVATISSPLEHYVDGSVTDAFPDMFYAYTVIDGLDIQKSNSELKKLTKQVIKDNTRGLDEIGEIKPIKEYREIFKKTGAWKLARRPSPEALLKRLANGKGIYNINTAVDAYNLAVIETGVGLGGFNADKISFPVTLRMTKAGETMHLLGDKEPTTVMDGEIAYADTKKLITLDLNYRDIDETKITEDTKKIILYADGAPGLTENEVVSALQKGASYIKQFCGGKVSKIEVIKGGKIDHFENQDINHDMTREEALSIVKEYVKNEGLIRHMLAVEAVMASYAKKFGEDEELYRVTGLLHDFDWEIHPTLEGHPQKGSEILRERGVSEEIIRAIMSHAMHTGVTRESNLEKALFASDEITGLIMTTALVRPSKKIADVEISSIKKKWKDRGFAAGVNRAEVELGATELGVDLWTEHVPLVLKAMQEIAGELGV